MKYTRMAGGRPALVLSAIGLLLFAAVAVFAQEGASSAAAMRARYLADTGYIPTSREISVEEFINYRRHRLPLPKVGDAVAMDTRWGNDTVSLNQPNAVLQIGFATAHANDRTDLRPLNLVLVIDKSGSMAEVDKMVRVKQALLQLVGQLRPEDRVAIVVFDATASVVMPSQALGNGTAFRETVANLEPGSATNLNAGLILGYQEAVRNFAKGATNRVILLTDGIANTGETDPKRIASASSEFNGQGIDLSTIGLGLELDKDLLRTLAKSGHGLFHFVADAQDIQKVFVDEVQSLVAPAARQVKLEINYDSKLTLSRVFGYEPRMGASSVSLDLDDMNQGLTEVVLADFRVNGNAPKGQVYPVHVKLSYFDIAKQKQVVLTDDLSVTAGSDKQASSLLVDEEVRKNYTIALLAQSIKDMAVAWEAKDYLRAESIMNASVAGAHETYPNLEDADIKYTLNIVEKYQTGLRKYNQAQRDAGPDR